MGGATDAIAADCTSGVGWACDPEIRIDCPEHIKFGAVERITEYYRERFEIVDTDGCRVIMPDGWGLVRASNTQPLLVLRFEADTREACERIEAMVRSDLERVMRP